MVGVTILLLLSLALASGIGVMQVLAIDRRQQERDGLFGRTAAIRRAESDDRSAREAATLAFEADSAQATLHEEGRRLAKLRARIGRVEPVEPGWWWVSFSEGTIMLLRSRRERLLRRLSRWVRSDDVRLTGVVIEGDGLSRLLLQVRHRPVALPACAVTVARRRTPGG